ncbi:GMC family oxidoreductase [Isoptericola sp. b441]|uniref:Cholesterol oxidase n=1 Tax=Actinotalea lenta TaxID=3064654 RepID=A0ABT9D604_9CELL|nr:MULTISPECIES: GMC family oxidoreductase [unclassified Isoptericola]MDO8106248.1 GMC family oxidoreductase [Isoptericola sp. b441]
MPEHVDVVVVGSGFGGSVAALRLVEKGYRVLVLEAGRRFADHELPRSSWDVRRFLWAPRLGCYGIQRVHLLRNVLVLAGAGVGGGSLVYANTLYRPPSAFYADPQWAGIADWEAELAPHFDTAERMLGVVPNPTTTASDRVMKQVADEMGVGHTFRLAPVGVFFGRQGRSEPGMTVPDPYFGGAGPARTGCTECGGCMTGCRVGAKNTLVKNYLYLAERAGVRIEPLATVTRLAPLPGGGYQVDVTRTDARRGAGGRRAGVSGSDRPARWSVTADQVVLAAGAWGTQQLLHRMRATGVLPHLSPRLGDLTRTNSEALGGATATIRHRRDADYSRGVAITSSFYPEPDTHVEPVRYAAGSNAMALLSTLGTPGGGRVPRPLRWLGQALRHPGWLPSIWLGRHWSERTIIGLVMQSRDSSLTLYPRRAVLGRWGRWQVTSRQGRGTPNPTWIPAGHEAMTRASRLVHGFQGSSVGEILDIPMTAHLLGGCAIGDSPRTGVVDGYHRVFGYPGLHVMDGSSVAANLGVNPSLTITALAERALSYWPSAGTPDPRPHPV